MRLPIVFLACLAMSKGFTLVSRLVTPSIQFNHTSSAKKDLNTFNMFNMFNHILQPFWLYSREKFFLWENNFYHFRHHSCCSFSSFLFSFFLLHWSTGKSHRSQLSSTMSHSALGAGKISSPFCKSSLSSSLSGSSSPPSCASPS